MRQQLCLQVPEGAPAEFYEHIASFRCVGIPAAVDDCASICPLVNFDGYLESKNYIVSKVATTIDSESENIMFYGAKSNHKFDSLAIYDISKRDSGNLQLTRLIMAYNIEDCIKLAANATGPLAKEVVDIVENVCERLKAFSRAAEKTKIEELVIDDK
ncbi:MAG: hypothetical protein V1839_00475 [archaeon]